MDGGEDHLAGAFLKVKDGLVGNHQLRPSTRHAKGRSLTWPAGKVAGTGAKVDFLDKSALAERHNDKHFLGMDAYLAGPTATRQAHLGVLVVADDGGVDVAKAVDLGCAQEGDLDPPSL